MNFWERERVLGQSYDILWNPCWHEYLRTVSKWRLITKAQIEIRYNLHHIFKWICKVSLSSFTKFVWFWSSSVTTRRITTIKVTKWLEFCMSFHFISLAVKKFETFQKILYEFTFANDNRAIFCEIRYCWLKANSQNQIFAKIHSLKVLCIKDELQTNAACDNVTVKNSKEQKVLKTTFDNSFIHYQKGEHN